MAPATRRNLCDSCYGKTYTPQVLADMQQKQAAKVAGLREARKTQSDGEMADDIIRRWLECQRSK